MENILITGASTGIGYNLCKVYLANNCRVLGSVRSEKDANRLAKELGENFHPLIFDVTDHKAIGASVDQVKGIIKDEGLNCLVNNAGIAVGGPVMYLDVKEYQRQFDVNILGVIAVTKAYLPLLGATEEYTNEPGKILNISSISGEVAFPFLSPYCASKSALNAFGDSLRRELLIYGIDVITIEPGPIKTPIWSKHDAISEEVKASMYWPALKKFGQQTRKSEERGMEPEDLAGKIFNVYVKRKPKTRYIFMKKKFMNFIIPRYFISPRKFDGFVRKIFFSK